MQRTRPRGLHPPGAGGEIRPSMHATEQNRRHLQASSSFPRKRSWSGVDGARFVVEAWPSGGTSDGSRKRQVVGSRTGRGDEPVIVEGHSPWPTMPRSRSEMIARGERRRPRNQNGSIGRAWPIALLTGRCARPAGASGSPKTGRSGNALPRPGNNLDLSIRGARPDPAMPIAATKKISPPIQPLVTN
jgi:hypothetical protein